MTCLSSVKVVPDQGLNDLQTVACWEVPVEDPVRRNIAFASFLGRDNTVRISAS